MKPPWWLVAGLVAAGATLIPTALYLQSERDGASRRPLTLRPDGPPRDGYSDLGWPDLIPAGSRPGSPRDGASLAGLSDDDPLARRRWSELQASYARAPVKAELEGRQVRLRGYAVPLSFGWNGTDEFLLVPYYGACIHSPPPPPNQVVYVHAAGKVEGLRAMSVVTVTGRLRVQAHQSSTAAGSYRIEPVAIVVD